MESDAFVKKLVECSAASASGSGRLLGVADKVVVGWGPRLTGRSAHRRCECRAGGQSVKVQFVHLLQPSNRTEKKCHSETSLVK